MSTNAKFAAVAVVAATFWAQDVQAQDTQMVTIQSVETKMLSNAGSVGFVSGELMAGKPLSGAPYSAQIVNDSIQTLADGNRIVAHSTGKVYRDSLGRERREMPLPEFVAQDATRDQSGNVNIFISDPVAGVNYMLEPADHTAIKLPAPPSLSAIAPPQGAPGIKMDGPHVISSVTTDVSPNVTPGINMARVEMIGGNFTQALPLPPGGPHFMTFSARAGAMVMGTASEPKIEQLGTQTIQGVQAQGIRTTLTIPAKQIGNDQPIQIVDERWYSSDLQVTVLSKHSDPRMGETSYSLISINRSEPSPSLFTVPPDYTIKDGPTFMALPALPAK